MSFTLRLLVVAEDIYGGMALIPGRVEDPRIWTKQLEVVTIHVAMREAFLLA